MTLAAYHAELFSIPSKKPGGVRKVSPLEMLREIDKRFGIKLSRTTLLNYGKGGCITEPERNYRGRGIGGEAIYSHETMYEVVVTWQLLNGAKWSIEKIAEYRKSYLNTQQDPQKRELVDTMVYSHDDKVLCDIFDEGIMEAALWKICIEQAKIREESLKVIRIKEKLGIEFD